MSILDFFEDKEKKYKDNCPTNVLLYLVTMRQCPVPVNPWYDKIKEYVDGANFHYPEFHRACILGMFPELEEPSKYFNEILNARLEVAKQTHPADGEARARAIMAVLIAAEKETIERFELPSTMFIGGLTRSQKRRVAENTRPLWDKLLENDIRAYCPAVQVLAQATKSALFSQQPVDSDFTDYFRWIHDCAEHSDRYPEFRPELDAGICHAVDALLDMKKQGIVSKDFRISNYKAFKESDLVKNFTYKGHTLDLTDHLMPQKDMLALKEEVRLSL